MKQKEIIVPLPQVPIRHFRCAVGPNFGIPFIAICSSHQVRRLFEVIDTSRGAGLLHLAVLSVLFSTGMRHGQIADWGAGATRPFPGGTKFRIELWGEYLGRQRRLKEQVAGGYLAQRGRSIALVSRIFCFGRRRIDSGPSWTLTLRVAGASQIYLPDKFVKDGELNKKLSSKAVDYMIKKYCRLIGVEGKITVHSARATVVGSLLEKGISIDKVASFVGHSDLGTTKAYNKRRTKIGESPAFDLDYWKLGLYWNGNSNRNRNGFWEVFHVYNLSNARVNGIIAKYWILEKIVDKIAELNGFGFEIFSVEDGIQPA